VCLLAREAALNPNSRIGDVGSGTGILSKLFLEAEFWVTGIEPNAAMRAAAETHLSQFPKFISMKGRAEATGLPDASLDLITAAQAFHWFQPDAARQEFCRILRSPRWVALIWNERRRAASRFMHSYEELTANHAAENQIVDHERVKTESVPNFFRDHPWKDVTLSHTECMDWNGLRARILSTSRMPGPGESGFDPMMDELRQLYRKHQVDGRVTFSYFTHVYFGTL
jgi:SAM-dependent methyltransferase